MCSSDLDSGGPALDTFGEVFGVLSRGAANSCDSPVYTRVDEYADWIRTQTARAAAMGGYAPPDWVTPPVARPGEIGDPCASDAQCNSEFVCRLTGTARWSLGSAPPTPGGTKPGSWANPGSQRTPK